VGSRAGARLRVSDARRRSAIQAALTKDDTGDLDGSLPELLVVLARVARRRRARYEAAHHDLALLARRHDRRRGGGEVRRGG